MALTRVSPGVYQNAKGQTVKGTTKQAAQQALGNMAKQPPKQPAGPPAVQNPAAGTQPAPPASQAPTAPQAGLDPRQQARLDFLLKNRPNDPQVKQLQAMQGGQQQGQPYTGNPADDPNGPGLDSDALGTSAGNLLDKAFENFGADMGGNIGTPDPAQTEAERNSTIDAAFKNLTRGLDDQEAQEQSQLEEKLANQGIPVGSELYNQQLENLGKKYSYQREDARNQATQQASTDMLRNATTQQTQVSTQESIPKLKADILAQLQDVFTNLQQGRPAVEQTQAQTNVLKQQPKLVKAQTKESKARTKALNRQGAKHSSGSSTPSAFG